MVEPASIRIAAEIAGWFPTCDGPAEQAIRDLIGAALREEVERLKECSTQDAHTLGTLRTEQRDLRTQLAASQAQNKALAETVKGKESIIFGLRDTMKDAAAHLDHNVEACGDEWIGECMRRARDALFEALRALATTDTPAWKSDESGRMVTVELTTCEHGFSFPDECEACADPPAGTDEEQGS